MDDPAILSIAFAPGVTVAKWTRIWAQRHPQIALTVTPVDQLQQVSVVLDGTAHLSFVRLPIESQGLNVIPLYRERTVVVAEKDHFIAAAEEVTLAELDGEKRQTASTAHADRGPFDLVAAGVGVLVVPHAIARQQSRKDVVVRPISDAPETQIALVWRVDPDAGSDTGTDAAEAADSASQAALIADFIGIVRGRTAQSSRAAAPDDGSSPQKKQSARQKGAAKAAAKGLAKAGTAAKNGSRAKGSGAAKTGGAAKVTGASHAANRKRAESRKKHRGH